MGRHKEQIILTINPHTNNIKRVVWVKMKKIFCKKCGYKILDSDTEFCPRCGTRVTDFHEVQKIEKNKRNRNILLALLIIIIIASIIILSSTFITNNNPNEFKRVNLSSTCSIELPNIHFDEQNTSFGGSSGGYSSQTQGRTLTSSKLIISYTKTVDNIGPLSNGGADINSNLNFGNTKIYSRDVFNYETQETIHIQGEDKELVDRVADSVQFSKGQAVNKNSSDNSQQNNNQKQASKNTNSSNHEVINDPDAFGRYVDGYEDGYWAGRSEQDYYPTPTPTPDPSPSPTPETIADL